METALRLASWDCTVENQRRVTSALSQTTRNALSHLCPWRTDCSWNSIWLSWNTIRTDEMERVQALEMHPENEILSANGHRKAATTGPGQWLVTRSLSLASRSKCRPMVSPTYCLIVLNTREHVESGINILRGTNGRGSSFIERWERQRYLQWSAHSFVSWDHQSKTTMIWLNDPVQWLFLFMC